MQANHASKTKSSTEVNVVVGWNRPLFGFVCAEHADPTDQWPAFALAGPFPLELCCDVCCKTVVTDGVLSIRPKGF